MADRTKAAVTGGRNPDGTFAKGNPGKPLGSRHKATQATEKLLEGQAAAITQKAIDLALEGDTTALRLCLERIAPPRKDAPVRFDLPTVESAQEASQAAAALLQAVAEGDVTPSEAGAVMALIDGYRKTLELTELEARVDALERKK